LENLLKIIKPVELTHKGLGVPTLFEVLSIIGGSPLFILASSGFGKTKLQEGVIEAVKTLPGLMVNNWNSMSYYELVESIGQVINKKLLWTVEEWSMLSDYHRETLLAIGAKVITDHNFARKYRLGNVTHQILIQNCDLTMIINLQPKKFANLMARSENWNSLAQDRFTKFCLFNGIMGPTVDNPPRFSIPDFDNSPKPQLPHPVLVAMFREHFTGNRSQIAASKYQEAWCKLNGTEKFSDLDAIMFQDLFWPYLKAWPVFIHGTDPDREETFYTGPYRLLEIFMENYPNPLSMRDILEKFHMISPDEKEMGYSLRNIYRHLEVLKARGQVEDANPEYGKYELSKPLRDYWNLYRELWD
jgi:hypothetical protein